MRADRAGLLALLPKQAVGAEIGVWRGDFSAELIAKTNPRKLYLIDPWVVQEDPAHRTAWYGSEKRPDMDKIHEDVLRRFAGERESGTVIVQRAFSHEALSQFPDGFFDYIYIDGDHEYSAVRRDCFIAFDKVRAGGYICGDDYSLGGWWKDGVVRAFHDLIHERAVMIRYARGSQLALQRVRSPTMQGSEADSLFPEPSPDMTGQDSEPDTGQGLPTFRNELEIRLFGLRRSGNHGFAAWLSQQYQNEIVYLNNVRAFRDPFLNFRFSAIPNAVRFRKEEAEKVERIRAASKELLLITYEDLALSKLARSDILSRHEEWTGRTKCVFKVLLLRDFYNWFGSRVRLFEKMGIEGDDLLTPASTHINLWLAYAREFAGETNLLGSALPVSFNKWVAQQSYRSDLLARLGIPLRTDSRRVVPKAGGGSSFDGVEYTGDADQMDLQGRWRYLQGAPYSAIRALIASHADKIDDYNSRIFEMSNPLHG